MNAVSRDSWSDLPNDLLTIISDRLNTRIDNLRLRAVCSSWRSTISIYNNNVGSLRLPMKLPYPDGVSPTATLAETIMYRIEPLDQDKFDSSCMVGWLIKAKEVRPNVFSLLNYGASKISFPLNLNLLNYRVFELGKFFSLIKCSAEKLIFSPDHNSLLAIVDGETTFFRFGDEKWTKLGNRSHPKYKDIITYKSEFHGIDKFGSLVSFTTCNLDITQISHPLYTRPADRRGEYEPCSPGGIYYSGREANLMYLMEGYGDLYVVVVPADRYGAMYYDMELNQLIYDDGRYEKTMHDIKTYKLNGGTRKRWVQVESLGDKVIILSGNDSLIASPEEFAGFRRNCIYFADQES